MPGLLRHSALAALALLASAACATVRPVDGAATPLGTGLDMHLPASPGWPGRLEATQTVVGQYGDRRAAFQAALDFSADKASVVLTVIGGPRILGITWTQDGVVEDRTPLAPDNLKGLNVLGDIFVSMWPVEAVRRAMPDGVEVSEDGKVRRVKTADRVIEEIETKETTKASSKRELRNLDFGYRLTIVTETGG